jgi:hypothetical protein
MTIQNSRRGFLRGLASLPLIGGAVTVIGNPTQAAEPPTEMMQNAYIAFLAHEHRQALQDRFSFTDWTGTYQPVTPMEWFPDYQEVETLVTGARPLSRAAVVLSAVGINWRERTL